MPHNFNDNHWGCDFGEDGLSDDGTLVDESEETFHISNGGATAASSIQGGFVGDYVGLQTWLPILQDDSVSDTLELFIDPTGIDNVRDYEDSADDEGGEDYGLETDATFDDSDNPEVIDSVLRELEFESDAENLMTQIRGWIPALKNGLIPGTIQHFLLLLIETSENIIGVQADMQRYLEKNYPEKLSELYNHPRDSMHGITNQQVLTSEFQMLRKLLKLVRANANANAISAIGMDQENRETTVSPRVLKRSSAIIDEFRHHIAGGILGEKDCLSLNSSRSEHRPLFINLRLARIDECQRSFADAVPNPLNLSTDACSGDSSESSSQQIADHDFEQGVPDPKELMIATACWLAKTRCATAVDLFCDVARLFDSTLPDCVLTNDEFRYLHYLATISPEPVLKHSGNPWVGYDPDMSNSQYSRDCVESQRALIAFIRAGPATPRQNTIGSASPPKRYGFQLTSYDGPVDGYNEIATELH